MRVRSPERSTAQRSVLARVSVGALLFASVIVIAVTIAASFGITWPGGKDRTRSAQIQSMPEDAIAMPDVKPRDARRADRHRTKKKAEHRRTVLMASDVKLLAPQGLVLSKAPVVPSTPVDETVTLAPKPKPQRSPAQPSPAQQPAAPAKP